MLSLIALLAVNPPNPPRELRDYLRRKDASVASRVVEEKDGQTTIELTSGTWQGFPWRHQILYNQPKNPAAKGTALLFITGDGPFRGDFQAIGLYSSLAGLPVAMLFDVPNQPIWDKREDDLIAHTFEQYLKTGDPSWPLLFPMTNAAIRAMDAVVKATAGTDNPIRRFVVTGASKRGWTTWLVGASGDRRVLGIAPMVIDNLNIPAQMRHQMASWNEYSPMIQDYTRRGLQAQMDSLRGRRLTTIVDPYSYRKDIRVPTLIVNGGNDEYWTTDALNQYWNDLRQPKWVTTVPNAGHNLGDGFQAAGAVAAFARSLVGIGEMPKISHRWRREGDQANLEFSSTGAKLERVVLWSNEAADRHFARGKWTSATVWTPTADATAKPEVSVRLNPKVPTALFAELRYRGGDRSFVLSTPTQVFPPAP